MITEDAVQAYNKQFKQLVGSKILNFKMVQCEFDPHQYWPTFSMQLADQKYKLVLSQDEEGNGGGFAFIEQESRMAKYKLIEIPWIFYEIEDEEGNLIGDVFETKEEAEESIKELEAEELER